MKMMSDTKQDRFELAVLRLEGRFDAHEEPNVRRWIDAQLTTGLNLLVVNLTHVSFIDSTALAVLVSGMKRSRETGGDLVLCGLAQPVRIIFELTRLDRVFDVFPSEEAAVLHICAGRDS